MNTPITRRDFVKSAAIAAAAFAAGHTSLSRAADTETIRKTPSYNSDMEYRRLGKTGLWVSAVSMGGHWKRIDKMIKPDGSKINVDGEDRAAFDKNRYEVLSRCMEVGINLVDACTGGEILAYSRALKGRRDKMYMSFSWYEKESRRPEYRRAEALLKTLEDGMKEAGLEHVDIWRISALLEGSKHTKAECDEQARALDMAKKQGKARFIGISSHDRAWLKMMAETYPDQMEVMLTPYTADSKELPAESLFEAVRKHDVGLLGIKPFASNSLFKGDSSPNSPDAQEDDKRARLAIRYILANPAITAPIPGLINTHQVDNMVAALKERRQLDVTEKAELRQATQEMWAKLPADYQWLRDWRNV